MVKNIRGSGSVPISRIKRDTAERIRSSCHQRQTANALEHRRTELRFDIVDQRHVRQVNRTDVLNDQLIGDFKVPVGKNQRLTHDFLGNANIRDDDWSRIVRKRSVTVVFTILAVRIDSAIAVVSDRKIWIWQTSVRVNSYTGCRTLIFKTLGHAIDSVRIDRDREHNFKRITNVGLPRSVEHIQRRIAFPSRVSSRRRSSSNKVLHRQPACRNKRVAKLGFDIIHQRKGRKINGSCVLIQERESNIPIVAVGNCISGRLRQTNIRNQQRRWIVAGSHIAVFTSVGSVRISSTVRIIRDNDWVAAGVFNRISVLINSISADDDLVIQSTRCSNRIRINFDRKRNRKLIANGKRRRGDLVDHLSCCSAVPVRIKNNIASCIAWRHRKQNVSSANKRRSKMSTQIFDQCQIREVNVARVLDHQLIVNAVVAVGQQRRRTRDFFDNADVRDDDGSRIVAEHSVHIVFAILGCRIDAIVAHISNRDRIAASIK